MRDQNIQFNSDADLSMILDFFDWCRTISAEDMAEIQIRMEEAAVEPFLRSIISRLKSSYIRRNVIGALALGLVVGICAGGCMGAMAAEMAHLLKDVRINETELRMKISNYTHHPILSTAHVTEKLFGKKAGMMPGIMATTVLIASSLLHDKEQPVPLLELSKFTPLALEVLERIFIIAFVIQMFQVSCGADLFYYFVTGGEGKVGTVALAATAGVLAVLSNISSMLGTGASLGVLLAASGGAGVALNAAGDLGQRYGGHVGRVGAVLGAAVGAFLPLAAHSVKFGIMVALCAAAMPGSRYNLFSYKESSLLPSMTTVEEGKTLLQIKLDATRGDRFGALGLGLVAGGCMGAMSAEMACFLKDATQSQTELMMKISELYPFITSSYVTYMSLLGATLSSAAGVAEFIFFLDLGTMLPLILPSLLLCLFHKFHLSKKAVAIPSIMLTTVLIARSYFHDKDQPVPSLDPAEFTIPVLLVLERFFVLVLGIQMFQASCGAVLFSYFVTEGAGDVCTGAVAATVGVLRFLLKTSNMLGTGASLGGLLAASGGAGVALHAAGDLGQRYGGLAGRAGAVIGGAVGAFLALATQNLKFGIMVSLCAAAIPGSPYILFCLNGIIQS
ncbi:hypothetical protein MHYP_G00151480 [Metynnis hypsauchen]